MDEQMRIHRTCGSPKNAENGMTTEKISKKTDKVEHELTYKQLYEILSKLRKEYTCHVSSIKFTMTFITGQQFQVLHQKLVPVLGTTSEIGPTYQDFSGNLSQMHKLETQSLHFSKAQYSLQCTAKQCSNSDSSPYQYLYHLSDVM